jgi:hypothetical protein
MAGTTTHDHKRHGTTTLFAALNVLDGTVIGRCMARHPHQEFLRFLLRGTDDGERGEKGRAETPRKQTISSRLGVLRRQRQVMAR